MKNGSLIRRLITILTMSIGMIAHTTEIILPITTPITTTTTTTITITSYTTIITIIMIIGTEASDR